MAVNALDMSAAAAQRSWLHAPIGVCRHVGVHRLNGSRLDREQVGATDTWQPWVDRFARGRRNQQGHAGFCTSQ
jgi:hypothetical protein